jgi:hypothetical protein
MKPSLESLRAAVEMACRLTNAGIIVRGIESANSRPRVILQKALLSLNASAKTPVRGNLAIRMRR